MTLRASRGASRRRRAAQGFPPGRGGRRSVLAGRSGRGPPDRLPSGRRAPLLPSIERRRTRGLAALVEVHDAADVESCRSLAPSLVGINCRDLATFTVDLAHPLALRPRIRLEDARLVFESGIRGPEDVRFARSAGFDGVLVGETAMRSPEGVPALLAASTAIPGDFWQRLYARRQRGRPLVKICGITRPQDAEAAVSLGADALGFVMAPSKRRAPLSLLRELRALDSLKVAVVVTERDNGASRLGADVRSGLSKRDLVDAVQFHGEEGPEECAALAFPYYKAVRVKETAGRRGHEPATAARACLPTPGRPTPRAARGKGSPAELARAVSRRGPLWIAGGIGPENVGEVVQTLRPELIDASSRLEALPAAKDREKLKVFFRGDTRKCRGITTTSAASGAATSRRCFARRWTSCRRLSWPPWNPEEFLCELNEVLRGLRRQTHPAPVRAERDPGARRRPHLHQVRRPCAHRGAQDQQRDRPGAPCPADGQDEDHRGDGRRPARRCHRGRLREARHPLPCLHGRGGHAHASGRMSSGWSATGRRWSPSDGGSATLKDAVNEALRDWAASFPDHALPPGVGARPLALPRHGARVPVGDRQGACVPDAREGHRLRGSWLPASAAARTQSGSSPLSSRKRGPDLIGVEAGGRGGGAGRACVPHERQRTGRESCRATSRSSFPTKTASFCPRTPSPRGSTTPGIGPQLAHLGETGRITLHHRQRRGGAGGGGVLRADGGHGLCAGVRSCGGRGDEASRATYPPEKAIVVNMSGRGDKDLFILAGALDRENWHAFLASECAPAGSR